jgi:CHAT domain-containing protein
MAAAPPARLTAAQREQLALRDRWLRRADARLAAGQIDEAIMAVRKGLALERAVFGMLRATTLPWLTGLAQLQEQQEHFAEALAARQERWRTLRQYQGESDWQVQDALQDVEDCRFLARLTSKQRQRLRQAEQWNARVGRLWQEGKSPEALSLAEKALAARRDILGENHRLTALSLNNLAVMHEAQGSYGKAEPLFTRALKMNERLYPRSRYPQGHPDLALTLNNLAELHRDQGEHGKAEPLFTRALKMNEALFPPARYPQGHPDLARSLNNLAMLHQEQGEYSKAEPLLVRALKMYEALFPQARYPQGHPDLARSINNLAGLHQRQGKYGKAEPLLARALKMREALFPQERYPAGHPDLAQSINNLAALHEAQGSYDKAEPLYARALQLREARYPRERFPQGHPDLATSINNLAALHQAQGSYGKAEPLFARALKMNEALFPKDRYPAGHPDLARSIDNLASLHYRQGEHGKAESLFRRALKMREASYPQTRFPQGHPDLANSINNLAMLHQEQGEYSKAEPLYARVLKMYEGLYPQSRYPQGHPDLALTLNNLAALHQGQGEHGKAAPLLARALKMREELFPPARFPQGHPDLAHSLNNLAMLHQSQGEYSKAKPLLGRALMMYEALYPPARFPLGHPDLAQSINNLAGLHKEQGEHGKAEPLFARALKMREELFPQTRFPQGHPDLAQSMINLAMLHYRQGEYSKAERLSGRALKMYGLSAAALATSAPEATALNYLSSLPLTRDCYLSVTRHLPRTDSYPAVWQSKAAMSRIYERRHLAVLAASSSQARSLWQSLLSLRRERETLLLAPANPDRAKERDKRLEAIDEDIRAKQADLRPLLPALKRSDELLRATPAHLQKALPVGTAFLDVLRYVHFQQNPKGRGDKGKKRTPRYVAFVVTRRGVKRVELGEARAIEEMLDLWRRALVEGSEAEPSYAEKVHASLWAPLSKHLPAKTTLVYVSPDAALNRLPFSALRQSKRGRRLIEEHALAVVPHGPMLLDRLTEEKRAKQKNATLLAMGAVAYDRTPRAATDVALRGPAAEKLKWEGLKGTQKELEQIVALAGERRILRREGNGAGVARLLGDLPEAETAHLATHGFFADAKFRSALQLDPKLFRSIEFLSGGTAQRIGAGSRSPLVLSGLVCSGANLPDTPNRGILTAEAIVGLDLRKMNLAVLSACESGLGETAGGEGVYGLVRAFHIAGTRNVAASLWKVDDEATAALMVLFYRHLWGRKSLPPGEALRQAQLALYRNPQHVKEWSAGRGPNLKIVLSGSASKEPKTPEAKRAPAKAWAAFVLSGPGD